MEQTLKFLLVAGEPSGDAHAADLVEAMRDVAPNINFEFFGGTGPKMREAGVESVVKTDELAIIGLVEEAKALPRFWRAFKAIRAAGAERRPDAVILVDWPDFNLRLATAFKRRGLQVIYYISPQLWAWRSYRARNIRRDIDLLLSILPFESDWYAQRGIEQVEYVGNPLTGTVHARYGRTEFCRRHNLHTGLPIIALLPGSRRHEVTHILPVMLESAALILREQPNAQFVLPLAPNRQTKDIELFIAAQPEVAARLTITQGVMRETVAAADVAAVASGTATLETALLGVPLAIVYKTSALNWHTLGRLVNVAHVGLVNLIAGERLALELLQHEFTAERLAKELLRLLEPAANALFTAQLAEAMEKLGHGAAAQRAAQAILEKVRTDENR